MKSDKIVIIGAGLGGTLLAIFLARRGHEVEVYERRPDMRKYGYTGGRSINLAISTRGISALEKVGLAEKVLENAIPMRGRMIHDENGSTYLLPYSPRLDKCIYSISRQGLNSILLDAADSYPNIQIHFNQFCQSYNFRRHVAFMRGADVYDEYAVSGKVIIACDGATSAIRNSLFSMERFNYSQTFEDHGYKELTIPAGKETLFQIEPYALHIWPRKSFMLIALPNKEGTFTCTLFLAYEGEPSFATLKDYDSVRTFFQKYFPDAYELIPNLEEEFFSHPTGSLKTVKCYPWVYEGQLALLGDAAHAVVPFYGQGMNCTFEDCVALDQALEEHQDDWNKALQAYQEKRKVNADAIADMAVENFIEMRDSVTDERFLRRRKAELILEEMYPDKFSSRYNMVSFTTVPYATALARARRQEQILETYCSTLKDMQDFDPTYAITLIEEDSINRKLSIAQA
ncbi:MAG: NAD(P)/FAD-dependent oxidoreductase [Bacteroidia bacterium]|nr:FAD-dependent monooxygenase [Bacteroidia bacterium]MDW8158801.1 NAD(P)/FAD-dependent oxidoreductase [Bacteroidia bacterium]